VGAGGGAAICHSRILATFGLACSLLCTSLGAKPGMTAEQKRHERRKWRIPRGILT